MCSLASALKTYIRIWEVGKMSSELHYLSNCGICTEAEKMRGFYMRHEKPFKTHITSFIFSVLREKFRLEPEDTGVIKGGTARLICAAPKGTPTPTIFWKKNGKVLDLEKDSR